MPISQSSQKVTPNGKFHSGKVHHYTPLKVKLEYSHTEACQVMLEEKPLGSGGVCEAFRVWFKEPSGAWGPVFVAKSYKFKYGFLEDHIAAHMGNDTAQKFNKLLESKAPSSQKVRFLLWNRVLEIGDDLYQVEELLPGEFIKYNNIFGDQEYIPFKPDDQRLIDLAAAFSHYSFVSSGHEYMFLDVQGVGNTYTDIAVVSRQTSQYGYTDTGLAGIQGFFLKHKCNALCKSLDLKPIDGKALPENVITVTDNEENPEEDNVEYCCLQEGVPVVYDPFMQSAIKEALKSEGKKKIKLEAGGDTKAILDLKLMQQYNLLTGEAMPIISRAKFIGPDVKIFMQAQVDGKEWVNLPDRILEIASKTKREGKSKVQIKLKDVTYDFDFAAMTQTNPTTKKTSKLRCIECEVEA